MTTVTGDISTCGFAFLMLMIMFVLYILRLHTCVQSGLVPGRQDQLGSERQ